MSCLSARRIAPDDSIFFDVQPRQGYFFETRTFKSHPVLAKVEKIMDGKTTKYKVYLKNGKVRRSAGGKVGKYAAAVPGKYSRRDRHVAEAANPQPVNDERSEKRSKTNRSYCIICLLWKNSV